MAVCPKCDTLDAGFYTSNYWCKQCMKEVQRKRYAAMKSDDKQRRRDISRRWLLHNRYGLTVEAFNIMLDEQNDCCALCCMLFTEDDPPCVDHCHRTGYVRGLLHKQ